MKLNLELEDMSYTDNTYSDRFAYCGKVIHKRYERTFKSRHRLSIFTIANGKFWMGGFFTPAGKSGDLPCRTTAQQVLDYFKELLENNKIQEKYIKGFEE